MSDKSNAFGASDTGHVWDDNLRELTNDPPKWWMIGLHASWIVIVLYGILYPTWPMLTTHTKGVLGWTSIGEYKDSLAAIEEKRAKYENKLPGMSAAAILAATAATTCQDQRCSTACQDPLLHRLCPLQSFGTRAI